MSLSTRVSRNTSGQLLGRLYTSALAFVITVLVLPRTLDEQLLGVFAFHLTLWQLLNNVLDFGTGTIVTRDAARDRPRAGDMIGLLVLTKLITGVLGIALLIGAAWWHEGSGLRFVLLLLAAPLLLAHAPAAAATIFHVDMKLRSAVLAAVAGQTTWLLATLGLALGGVREPGAYLIAFGLGILANGTLAWVWARRDVQLRLRPERGALLALWKEAWPAGVSMSMASVYFYVDQLMLRSLAGEAATGQYFAAYRVMTFALMVPVLASNVLFPVFSRLHASGGAALRVFFERSVVTLGGVGLAVAATLPWVAADILVLLFPAAFLSAAATLSLLAFAIALVFCTYPHVLLVLAAGGQKRMMWVSISAVLLNVLANLWLIPLHGMTGAAATTVATELFVLIGAIWNARALTGLVVRPRVLARPLGSAALAAGLTAALCAALPGDAHLLRLAGAMLAGGVGVWLSGALPVDLGTEEGAPE